ncbi:LOW QUALITY PROTEIN: G patch domain-containing protein 3-like [Paramacrobiotus metropolitanus]|uniref:LOW QUALITY PROTEIN: G patch domain-containing protein 3-like n=1 Tax=Paramacrobiotus metropolitanus TaxID=2943436 RepID=UPI002445D1ED|nr:LOW QUALITY PROTEIN: G patch domain-containing protein 3-like [Paramacrobiotus metropolitanus]
MCSFTEYVMADEHKIVVVRNIPAVFHSSDLRSYFSTLIETECFACFHYRHRPEVLAESSKPEQKESQQNSSSSAPDHTRCCFVKVKSANLREFLLYNGRHWTDEKGSLLPSRCHIIVMKLPGDKTSPQMVLHQSPSLPYLTRHERRMERRYHLHHQNLQESDVQSLIEMNPPALMPQGNVGTPTKFFLALIQKCQMPSSLIKSLGLRFPKGRRNRKYGQVPMNYGTDDRIARDHAPTSDSEEDIAPFECHQTGSRGKDDDDVPVEDRADADNDECEEWERHEAFGEDVTTHERNKERLFEDEQEVVWEKGGPGIVWNMDANFWKEQDGGSDLDEATDDWDVDMSMYYEDDADRPGDKDARDFMQIRRERQMRNGSAPSLFRRSRSISPSNNFVQCKIGGFEKHTKGFGRKIMERSGWKEGRGLGKWREGMADALASEGQQAWSKKGVGYLGPALNRKPVKRLDREMTAISKSAVLEAGQNGVRITTRYDSHDEGDSLKRRVAATNLKYRAKQ